MLSFEEYLEKRNTWIKGEYSKFPIKAMLGVRKEDGIQLIHEFNGKNGNLLMHGIPGSGLINEVNIILYNLAKTYGFNDLCINVIDCAGVGDFDSFSLNSDKFSIGIEVHTSSNKKDVVKMLSVVFGELKLLMTNTFQHKPYILFINELSRLQPYVSDSKWKNIIDSISDIIVNGHKQNIFVVMIDSDVNTILKKSIKDNIHTKLVLRCYEATSHNLLPEEFCCDFPEKYGTGYYYIVGEEPKCLELVPVPVNLWREV